MLYATASYAYALRVLLLYPEKWLGEFEPPGMERC